MTIRAGETLARSVALRIATPAADTSAIEAIAPADRSGGMLCVDTDTGQLWVFDEDSSSAASASVLVPDDGDGRWLASSSLTDLASVSNGDGASLIGIEDAGAFTSAGTVEAALAEIYQHIKSTKAHVLFSLRDFREVTSGGDVGDDTANGGVLSSGTTPILRADANESEEIAWATGNADIISVDVSLPQDFDGTANATLDLFVASGTTNGASFSVLTSWDKGTQVTDSVDDSGTKSATFHTVTCTIAAADIPNSPTCVTIQLVPPAHATDAILLGAIRLNYKRKLLTS
jgi:hypothetical protein